ncbi:hypothetical protein Pcinc_000599 [Petrolisthes cinctipes]|uniref:Uncharacterized protein n=1 Tax=Petrolisthes cinctipes TaxID=88211 RepID=A0AAE1GPD6_PETCI|nr:hypothetical protein Pcinc_000599 [Petrolisthes cinctipes]
MDYSGPNLDLVLRGNHNVMANDIISKEMCIYNVIMMQSTPGQYTIPLLSGLLRKEHKDGSMIRDSTTAVGVLNIFKCHLLNNIPFFLCQTNIITRLGQQEWTILSWTAGMAAPR